MSKSIDEQIDQCLIMVGSFTTDEQHAMDMTQARKRLKALINQARIDELSHVAPDMRIDQENGVYIETSASGKWQSISDRLAELKEEK